MHMKRQTAADGGGENVIAVIQPHLETKVFLSVRSGWVIEVVVCKVRKRTLERESCEVDVLVGLSVFFKCEMLLNNLTRTSKTILMPLIVHQYQMNSRNNL